MVPGTKWRTQTDFITAILANDPLSRDDDFRFYGMVIRQQTGRDLHDMTVGEWLERCALYDVIAYNVAIRVRQQVQKAIITLRGTKYYQRQLREQTLRAKIPVVGSEAFEPEERKTEV